MNTPLVSVIVPTRNRPQQTVECVKSVKAQDYTNIEVLVIDGNSTDDTREVVKPYADIVITFPEVGDHRCAQRNLGVKVAKGKYVLIIDSDMVLSPTVIHECVAKIESNDTYAALVIPEESFGTGFWAQCKALEKKYYQGIEWMEAARFYKRDIFVALGGYNPELTSGEDWDLSQRASGYGNIGRIESIINHDEGKISLFETMRKKFYYASKFGKYKRQTKSNYVLKQTSVISRYILFFSNFSLIKKYPLTWIGLIFMKTCEFASGALALTFNKNYE